jgi:hypothetical protein
VSRLCPAGLALVALCAGCVAARSGQPTLRATETEASGGWRTGEDGLSLNMRAIATQLESAGLKPGQEIFRGFLTAGARATHGLELPARSCVTLIAIASQGVHDMDAALYSPDGDLLAVDSQPDAHPTIQVCTGDEPHTLYYALQVYEGAGSFLMAGFLGQQSTLEAAAKLLGARPAVARLGHAEPDGPGRVSAFRDGLQRRGFQPVQPPLRVPLTQDQTIRVALRVEPGQCYTAAGFALDGISNVDLRVLDEEGSEVARDASEEQDAGAQFCAERRAEYATELHSVAGTGTALLLLFHVDAASIGGQSGLWLGERPLTPAATAPLPETVEQVARRASQDGFKLARTLRTGQLGPGEVIAQPISLHAQRCARIEAIGGPGLGRIGLVAASAAGFVVTSAEGETGTTYVHLCSTIARELNLQVHAASGSGPFMLTAHEAPISAVVPAGADELLGAQLQQLTREARDLGYRPQQELEGGPRHLTLRSAEPLVIKLAANGARCVRAYILSHEPSARAQLVLAGKQLDAPASQGRPARFCVSQEQERLPDPIELRVTSTGAESDGWLMVLVR